MWNRLLEEKEELLAEVKQLREVVDKQQMQYVNLETAYYNSPSEIEVKRLREGIKDLLRWKTSLNELTVTKLTELIE